MMKIFQLLTLLLAGRGATATQDGADILDIARDTEGFSTLAETLDASGLAFVFDQNFVCTYFGWFCHEYTVFAPTDDAFDALGEDTLERLLDKDYAPHLKDILLYHAVSGEIFSSDISDGAVVETLNHEVATRQRRHPAFGSYCLVSPVKITSCLYHHHHVPYSRG